MSTFYTVSKKTVPFLFLAQLCQTWIDFNDSFTIVTTKFLYTNIELNLQHHLNYVAALPCKCTQRIVHVNRWPSAPWKTRLYSAEPVATKYPRSELQLITRSGLSCKIVSTRQKSVAWINGGWSTSGVALNSRWLLTTSIEDFGRVSIWKEDNSNTTCELAILILSVSVNFSVTFISLLPCYIFHSKSVPAKSTIRPTRVFVLQGSAATTSGDYGRFYSMLWRRYLLSDVPKNIKIGQQLSKL